jgi:hypothetical protein
MRYALDTSARNALRLGAFHKGADRGPDANVQEQLDPEED